jgi:hypothetical protein
VRHALIAVCALALGCDDRTTVQPPIETTRVLDKVWAPPRVDRIDVLFVVDRSPAIDPLRATLAHELELAGAEFDGMPGYVDLHVGVVDASGGALLRSPLVDGPFITVRKSWAGQHTNVADTVAAALPALADLDAVAADRVQPLETMRIALADNEAGFSRPNARLVVIFVTVQLDQSPRSLDAYAAFLKGVPSSLFGAQVYTVTDDPKLHAFANLFPERNTSMPLVNPDLAGLADFVYYSAHPWDVDLTSPCFDAPLLDTDPIADGLQPDCVVTEGSALVPTCTTAATLPCWRIDENSPYCSLELPEIAIDRADIDPEDGAFDRAQCVPR